MPPHTVSDALFSWDYDILFTGARKYTTIVGIACTSSDDACFCTAVGWHPDCPQRLGPLPAADRGGGFVVESPRCQGSALKARYESLLDHVGQRPTGAAGHTGGGTAGIWRKSAPGWTTTSNTPVQEVCRPLRRLWRLRLPLPGCHCSISSTRGARGAAPAQALTPWLRQVHHDASAHNPRDVHGQRYRNRIMHKFKYYADKFGQTLWHRAGRCIRWCPVGIDIKAVLDEINKK